ncbi:MAG: serine/threonine protein kinase [Alkalinema sp. CAN_BIN05]|nr:serine/threonine protein kinase [Alkalinema sp. CAN_BIN05]
MHLLAGTPLKNGQYILNHILDQQGIGWTYRATQTDHNQTVLIKTLNPTLRSHPQFGQICQDFIARSRDLAGLRHPSLVKVFDIFQDQNMPFVVMEYVQGISLDNWINDRLHSETEVIQFLSQMTQVLSYLQQHNYYHGNLKPRNIICRNESESKSESTPESTPSTVVLVGFAPSFVLSEMIAKRNPYSAPELRTGRVSDKSDLYSLSGLLYYCLTQHPPLDGESESDRLPLLSLLKPGAQRLLRSATHLNPNDRPTSPDLWLAQLSKSRPTVPNVSPVTQIQAQIVTPLPKSVQELYREQEPRQVSTAPTYLQDPDSTPLLRSPSAVPASTQIQQAQTSIQSPIQNTAIQTNQESPRSVPLDRVKTVRSGAALPENLPRYRTTPLMPPKTSNSDQDFTESTISGRVSMKRLPSLEKSYDRAKYIKPGSSLFFPKLWTVQIIGAIGAILGLIFGLVLRFQASHRPGASFFHTGQSFPPREWKGTTSPNEINSNIFVEPGNAPPSSESAAPQTAPGKPTAEPIGKPADKFPIRAEPFLKDDAIVPANQRPQSPSKDAKPRP